MASSFPKRRLARTLLLASVALLGAVPFARAQTGLPAKPERISEPESVNA